MLKLYIQFGFLPKKRCVNRRLWADAIDGDVKGVDLICELSLISLLCTNLSATSQKHIWGKTAVLCTWARVCVCGLNVLPFIDLKTQSFCALVKPHVEVAAQFIQSTAPFSPLPISTLWWCDITLLGHQISQSHRGDMLLTSWLFFFYLLNWEKFPLI